MLQSKGYRRWNDWFKSEKPKCRFQIFPSISAFTTLSLLTKLADLNVHKIQKRTDVKNGRFYNLTNFFLILRRNEAERKHTAQINQLQYLFFTAYSFGMHATKGSTTNFSISKELQPISSLFLFVFLHLSSFLSAIENYRASTGLGLRANFCTLFLVRTCLKLPSPGHALRICLRHHFWTGLARLFRTIGIWMLKKSFFFELKIPVSFLFSM